MARSMPKLLLLMGVHLHHDELIIVLIACSTIKEHKCLVHALWRRFPPIVALMLLMMPHDAIITIAHCCGFGCRSSLPFQKVYCSTA